MGTGLPGIPPIGPLGGVPGVPGTPVGGPCGGPPGAMPAISAMLGAPAACMRCDWIVPSFWKTVSLSCCWISGDCFRSCSSQDCSTSSGLPPASVTASSYVINLSCIFSPMAADLDDLVAGRARAEPDVVAVDAVQLVRVHAQPGALGLAGAASALLALLIAPGIHALGDPVLDQPDFRSRCAPRARPRHWRRSG